MPDELLTAVNEVGSQTSTMNNYLIDTYSDVFEDRRCLPGDYRIELDPTVTLVKQYPRISPLLRSELKTPLDNMERRKS